MLLFCTRDAGPAEYLSRIIKHINYPYECFGTNVSQKTFLKHGIDCELNFPFPECSKYECVVTSACVGDSLDNYVTKWAKQNGTYTISFVEHWSWMKERFFLEDERVLPDDILVNDVEAMNNAIVAGIPEDNIFIVGNPVLEEVPNTDESVKSTGYRYDGNAINGVTVLFVSEELLSAFPKNSDQFLGFDEFDVLKDIVDTMGADDRLIIKLHPDENASKFSDVLHDATCIVEFIADCDDINGLILFPDFVIGMGSMLLLEAARIRADVITYRPAQNRTFIGNDINVTYLANNKDDLIKIFNREIQIKNDLVGDRFNGSLLRIISHIENRLDKKIYV